MGRAKKALAGLEDLGLHRTLSQICQIKCAYLHASPKARNWCIWNSAWPNEGVKGGVYLQKFVNNSPTHKRPVASWASTDVSLLVDFKRTDKSSAHGVGA